MCRIRGANRKGNVAFPGSFTALAGLLQQALKKPAGPARLVSAPGLRDPSCRDAKRGADRPIRAALHGIVQNRWRRPTAAATWFWPVDGVSVLIIATFAPALPSSPDAC
ncbi:hypothetical protein C7408_10884 [Paraburkholderia caballeronis]|nr:hypothetical protein C7408_10884 [Paraburkholderia caballeronis]TDV15929.1 hypothetical protein C7406_10984 [Paraburkholderia caballeronis]TDV25190.1 hypothetical protein C7404_10884 [Paraburkholderia caballeronis]